MTSWSNNSNNQLRTASLEDKTPLSKRRLKTKPTLTVVAVLLIGNIFWFVLWIFGASMKNDGGDEIVATIDGEVITRQEWMASMESLYGKETLHSLVNDAVMERAAKEYDITVTEAEIDLEIALMSSTKDLDTSLKMFDEKQTRQLIRAQLILEKVLTKDVVIEDSIIQSFYNENKLLYNTPTTYRTGMIVVDSIDEATQVQNELKSGADFSMLARERSLDTSSASLGGNIGYISANQTTINPEIHKVAQELNINEVSEPFALNNGTFALLTISEIIEGKSFSYEEVKEHIKTELAMEQLPTNVSAEMFWEEFNVTSYYLK